MFATIRVCLKTGGGGYQILFGSAICSFLMFIILLYKKRNTWTWLEVVLIILIGICGVTWIIKGPYETVVLGVISESIIGIYLAVKTFLNPIVKYNLKGYTLFLIASIIATYAAREWSWQERGYSTSEIFITSITMIPLMYKKWKIWKRNKNIKQG